MSEKKSKTLEEKIAEYEYYLKTLENQMALLTEREEEHRRHIDLTKSIALGLFYGIIGNFFVQFLYVVVEGIILGKFESPFLWNTIMTIVSLFIILIATLEFRNKIWERERKIWDYKNSEGEIRAMITGMKEELENLKKTR